MRTPFARFAAAGRVLLAATLLFGGAGRAFGQVTGSTVEAVQSSAMSSSTAAPAAAADPLVWQTAQPNRWAPERGPESSSAKCPRFLTRREHPTDVLERQIVPAPDRQRTPSSGYAADRLLRAGRASAPSTAPPTSPF